MKKAALIVMAVVVAVMFAVPAFAAESTQCNTCAKPCNTCAKPCNTCTTPCMALPKVSVDWKWPKVCVEKCAPCKTPCPCAPKCVEYKRDVLGQKTPAQTVAAGDAKSDTATKYENTLITANQ
jgi:hypothetical protein